MSMLLLRGDISYVNRGRLVSAVFLALIVCGTAHLARGESAGKTSDDWAALSDEALAEKMEMARAELLQLRSRRHQARQALEANNETARAIIQEMNELRRQLREKNAELEALLVEDERFAEWSETEASLAEMIRSSTVELQRREQDRQTTASPSEKFLEIGR